MKLRITEEQLKALLGQGFVKYLNESEVSYDDAGRALTPGMETNDREYNTISPNDVKYKMVQLGGQTLNKTSMSANDKANDIIKYMIQCNGGKPLSLIETLQVLQQIKSDSQFKTYLDSIYGEGNIKVEDFLNTISINTILSNFLTQIPQDYVFYRLTHLTPGELENIKKVYKVDFINFGHQCDACGINDNWPTSIFKGANGDAHINLEYMGKDKSSLQTQKLRFQIHHMNGNPSDNNPLNLACLCPNCHSITDTFGKNKPKDYEISPEEMAQLQKELKVEGETDEVVKNVAQRMIEGYFNDKTIQKTIVNNIDSDDEIAIELKQEVDNLSQVVVETVQKIKQAYDLGVQPQNDKDSGEKKKGFESSWIEIGKYTPNQDLIKGCSYIGINYHLKKVRERDFSTGKEYSTYKGDIKLIPYAPGATGMTIKDNTPNIIDMSYCQNADNRYLQQYVESVLAPFALWSKTQRKLDQGYLRDYANSNITSHRKMLINLQAKENVLAQMHPELMAQITETAPQERMEQIDALIAKLPDKSEVNAAVKAEKAKLEKENKNKK